MLTTIGDLLKWNANFETPVVGDAALVAQLQTPAVSMTAVLTSTPSGSTWIPTAASVKWITAEAPRAYVAHLVRYPDEHVPVAVLCNVDTAPATSYAKAVAALLPIGVVRVEAGKDGLFDPRHRPLIPQSVTRFVTADRRRLEFNGREGLVGPTSSGRSPSSSASNRRRPVWKR